MEREFDDRTSLIVDPPDGKLPPYTPAGQRRLAALAAATAMQNPPAGPEDLTTLHPKGNIADTKAHSVTQDLAAGATLVIVSTGAPKLLTGSAQFSTRGGRPPGRVGLALVKTTGKIWLMSRSGSSPSAGLLRHIIGSHVRPEGNSFKRVFFGNIR